jgi:uncharacterized protein (TIGR02271 family)
MKVLAALYDTYSEAQMVVSELVDAGFNRERISLVANNASGNIAGGSTAEGEDAVKSGEGAGFGAVVGTLVALGALLIPGVGPIIAAGPAAVALGAGIGAAAGAVTGGITAGLVKTGISEEDAEYYAEGVRRGGTLVTLEVDEDMADDAERIMNAHSPVDLDVRGQSYRSEGWSRFDETADAMTVDQIADRRAAYSSASTGSVGIDTPSTSYTGSTSNGAYSTSTSGAYASSETSGTVEAGEEARFQVVEENLAVGKREVERGGVRVYSTISERPVEEQVRLREERVRIERRPVDAPATSADLNAFQNQTIEVTERAEVPVVQKTARVVEEVIVGKEVTEHTETVRDSVRRTDVQVEELGAGSPYTSYNDRFRTIYANNYASSGYTFEDYEPAYRYGYDLANNQQYSGYTWEQLENQARSDWETRYPQNAWDRFGHAVRDAWRDVSGRS